jgi:hypothetical protein
MNKAQKLNNPNGSSCCTTMILVMHIDPYSRTVVPKLFLVLSLK